MHIEARPEHVIWISSDHMRYDCISANGNPAVHTPNLDFLVRHGISFTGCFAQNPVCMPSRASFMTGLYPQQTGIAENGPPLPPDFEPIVTKLFKTGGFQTVQIGKLHLQPHEDSDLDPRARHNYGFDIFWCAEEPGCYEDAYMNWLRAKYPQYVEKFRIPRPTSPERGSEREGYVIDAPWEGSFSGWVADTADRYLMQRKTTKQFIHTGFYAPHPPLNPTKEMFEPYAKSEIPHPRITDKEWLDKPEPVRSMLKGLKNWAPEQFLNYRRHFYAMVTGMDMAIGKILNRLKAEGILEDTLIIFVSDHGDMCGDHGMVSKGTTFFDEIMHLPCVLYWPKGFGTKCRRIDGLIEMVDLLPTLSELCGFPVPQVMSGKSYAKELLSGKKPVTREDVIAFHAPATAMLRTEKYKYIRYNNLGTEVLYDLSENPAEVINHAGDKSYSKILIEMRERMLNRFLDASRPCRVRHHLF